MLPMMYTQNSPVSGLGRNAGTLLYMISMMYIKCSCKIIVQCEQHASISYYLYI